MKEKENDSFHEKESRHLDNINPYIYKDKFNLIDEFLRGLIFNVIERNHKMKKDYLMAPGPTPVPQRVLLAMAEPIIHHRGPKFREILGEIREGLRYLFQTKNDVLMFASTGTGAMEGAVSNLLCKGDTALVVRGGKFGERWAEICEAFGVKTINIDVTWGEAVKPDDIKAVLSKEKDIKAVFIQAHETSTGVKHPVKEIAAVTNEYPETVLVVDAISALGVYPLPMDEWKIDVMVAGSQKAMMLPPGLSFVALSDKAWAKVEKSDLPKFYFNFLKERKSLAQNKGAYTSAVTLVIGLREILKSIQKEGLENIYKRHALLAEAARSAIKAMGLNMYTKENPCEGLTAVLSPEGINAQDIVATMREKYGITIAGGQAQAKGKIFRLAHMGYMDQFDLISAISALELTLQELGFSIQLGAGLKAAQEVLAQGDLK